MNDMVLLLSSMLRYTEYYTIKAGAKTGKLAVGGPCQNSLTTSTTAAGA
jgi:hypothetical protein